MGKRTFSTLNTEKTLPNRVQTTDGIQATIISSSCSSTTDIEHPQTPSEPAEHSDVFRSSMLYSDKLAEPQDMPGSIKKTRASKESHEAVEPPNTARVVWSPQEPSRDLIALQLAWWGYQIYIPTRVLKPLKDRQLKKRADFVNMQLSLYIQLLLFFMLPPWVRWSIWILSKSVVPKINQYVINFWDRVVSFDRGDGVVLSASWIAPLVYVPDTRTTKSPKLGGAQKAGPRIKEKIRATSIDDAIAPTC